MSCEVTSTESQYDFKGLMESQEIQLQCVGIDHIYSISVESI